MLFRRTSCEGSVRRLHTGLTPYLELAFDRTTRRPGYAFVILCGDRDDFCSVDEAATAYRALRAGELAILPNPGHVITEAGAATLIDFLERHSST